MKEPDWEVLWHRADVDFIATLAEYCGVDPYHPKISTLWSIAWDRGHSGGLSDVVYYFEEMAELIK